MAEGKQRDEWARTSALMAQQANLNRTKKSDPIYSGKFFNPFYRRQMKRRQREKVAAPTFDMMFPPNLIDVSRFK